MDAKHLKPHLYYSDLYDKHTVELCRRTEKSFNKKDKDLPSNKDITKEQAVHLKKAAKELYLHFETGERYSNKGKTIREWMERDQSKDDLYESAQAPEDIRCLTCRNRLKPTFKELWTRLDKEDRVLFMYDCTNKCLPRRAFFSDGEEWRTKPNLCLHCDTPLESKMKDTKKKLITTNTCPKCGHTETDEIELTHGKKETLDEDFAKDRDRFCLTDEEGSKYQGEKIGLEQMGKFMEEWKEKDKAREDKLKKNPKGFHLEGAGYTCSICRDSTPEGDNWYDKWGIKCLVCQKAIDNKEIPASLAKNKESWYSKYDIERSFNVKSPTLRKWIKEGIIKARTVSRYGEGVHVQLFLIKDNKDFLPPKKLVESKSVKVRKDGKEYNQMHPWYHFDNPHKHLKRYRIMEYLKVTKEEK